MSLDRFQGGTGLVLLLTPDAPANTTNSNTTGGQQHTSSAGWVSATPGGVLHAEEHAPEIDGVDLVKLVHVGVEQVLRVPVKTDGRIVHLQQRRTAP